MDAEDFLRVQANRVKIPLSQISSTVFNRAQNDM
jgi:hypothetical protein